MSVQFLGFSSFTKFNEWLAANPALVLEFETYERHNEMQPTTFRQSITTKVWTPPTNAIVSGIGPRGLSFEALDNLGVALDRWWVAGTGDTGTGNNAYNPAGDNVAGKGPDDIYVGAGATSSNDGNGRIWYFGGATGAQPMNFDEIALHLAGDFKNAAAGTNMVVAVYGLLANGGRHLLKKFVDVASGGGNSDGVDSVEIVTAAEAYVGIQLVTANLANGTTGTLGVQVIRRNS